jgi:hypothetical protein
VFENTELSDCGFVKAGVPQISVLDRQSFVQILTYTLIHF